MKRLPIALALLLTLAPFIHGKTITLTNNDGQSIEAEILDYANGSLRIKLASTGQTFPNVPLESLDESSQLKVRQWARSRAVSNERLLKATVARKEDLTRTENRTLQSTGGHTLKNAISIRYSNAYYRVTLENRSDIDLKDISVEYIQFSSQQIPGAKNREADTYQRHQGVAKIEHLKPRSKVEFDTKPIELMETKLSKGVNWANTARSQHDGKLEGVWLRFYSKDGAFLYQYTMPEGLPNRETWPRNKRAASD